MGEVDTVGVEDADGVVREILDGVLYLAGRVADGAAGVPVVIPDDVPAAVGELAAEVLGPPHRRSHRAHDEENGRVRRVSEVLRIEVDSVRLNLLDFHSSKKLRFAGTFAIPTTLLLYNTWSYLRCRWYH